MTELEIDYCGDVTLLAEGDALEFGRGADLDIDENKFLHRRLGRIFERRGQWWLANLGRSIPITVHDRTSRSEATVAPGTEFHLVYPDAVLRFSAGPTTYEIDLRQPKPAPSPDLDQGVPTDTITVSDLPLTVDQRLLIVVLAEPALADPIAKFRLPTNREAAHRLDWKITKFNRKLDNVCEKLTKRGVTGLHSGGGAVASDRRTRLVQYAISTGLVTSTDLELLPEPT